MATGSPANPSGQGIGLSFSFRAAGMDRPSTIMLCRVAPGIGFKLIRVFSASATNSGSLSGQNPLPRRARDPAARRAALRRDARNYLA